MKIWVALALAAATTAAAMPGAASVQQQMYCWVSESEFPVVCDEEEEGDDARLARSFSGHGPLPEVAVAKRMPPVPGLN